jgi:hypothetical protein
MDSWLADRTNLKERKRMIHFDLVLPYVLRDFQRRDVMDGMLDEDGKPHHEPSFLREPALVTDFLIRFALAAKYGHVQDDKASGVNGTPRRINGQILNMLGTALDGLEPLKPYDRGVKDVPQPASLEISRESLKHLQGALDDWKKCNQDHVGLLETLQEHVEDILAADKRGSNGAEKPDKKPEPEKAKA